ncbi:MAG: hypothetical protein AAF371_08185 [Pseudomonadota bacterium]
MAARALNARLAAAALVLGVVWGGDGPAGAAETIAGPAIRAEDVIAAISDDLDGDGAADRAMLVEDVAAGEATLLLFTGHPRDPGFTLALQAVGLAWSGRMFGTIPWLEVTARGSLRVHAENASVGRNRWRQVHTIAWRGGSFVLAGYSWESFDTLDPAASMVCDLNLLTGRAILNGTTYEGAPRRVSPARIAPNDLAPCPGG